MNINELLMLKVNYGDENLTKATWLIRLRWIAILFQTVVMVVLALVGAISFNLYPYLILMIIVLVVLNTTSTIFIKDRASVGLKFVIGQICFDLTEVFLFLFFLSIGKNPLIEILYLYLVLVIFVLPMRINIIFYFIIVAMTAFFYIRANHFDHHNISHFYSHLFTMSLLFLVINWLMRILIKYQNTLKTIQENKNRMDRLKSIGAMSSGICHELATPLNTIKLKLNRMDRKKEFLSEDVQVSIEAILQCEHSIQKLAQSMVDVESTAETSIKLYETLEEIKDNYDGCNILINCNEQIALDVNLILFYQTMFDIIDNAVEASHSAKIEINVNDDEYAINLKIINDSSQFPKIVLEKFGEPFLTTKNNGNGLGLFNAYNFMMACNGQMSIQNLENNRAMVFLRFIK